MLVEAQTMDPGILQLIGGLGSSAAAVAVTWFFLVHLRQQQDQQEKRDDRMFAQFNELAKDRGQIIRDNTIAMGKLESSIEQLSDAVGRIATGGDK